MNALLFPPPVYFIDENGEKHELVMLSVPNPKQLGTSLAATLAHAERLVIGKLADLKTLGQGERTLVDRLSDLRSPKANWAQNSSVLRQEMSLGRPIRDATVDPGTGGLINNTGFLRAERNLLENRGWIYNSQTRMWNPAGGP